MRTFWVNTGFPMWWQIGRSTEPDVPVGQLGYDAPSNIGIMLIGGTAVIEEKWLAPIGDEIKCISIDMTKGCLKIPNTVSKLTNRVINLMPVFMQGHITWNDAGEMKKFHVKVTNQLHSQQWLECTLHLPQDWMAQPGGSMCINLNQRHGGCAVTKFDFAITPQTITRGRYDILLEIKSNGRLNKLYMELPLIAASL